MNQPSGQPELIVKARWIIRDHASKILLGHAVAIRDGRITEIAPLERLKQNYPTVDIVGGDCFALMPGFVNSHHHSFGVSSVMRGVPDQVLEPWIVEMSDAPGLPNALAARLAAVSLLRSGVTTTVDMCGGSGSIDEFSDGIRETARGYRESGIRAILAPGMRSQNLFSQADGGDEAFIASLSTSLRKYANEKVFKERPAIRDYIDCVGGLVSCLNDQGMTEVWFGPPGLQWCGMEAFSEIVEAAKTLETRIQTHVLESFSQRLESRNSSAKSRVQALAQEGLLSPRVSFAHMVWASDPDIETVAHHGVSIGHNPSSNLRLQSGIAPLQEFIKAGVTVGLGLDGTSLNEDDDMFTEIRLAAVLNNARVDCVAKMPLAEAFQLATVGGARLIGRISQVGLLAPGASADLFLLDLERLEWPWVDPGVDPLDLILARAKREDITSVMVEGRWRIWERKFVDQNILEMGLEAAEHLSATLPAADRRDEARKLARAVNAWHQSWVQTDVDGRAVYNSAQ